ncbi:MAG: 2-C-methyl-D-erythritol 4-phosphate cytidylyltransferase [Lentimicrobiaceae bacterium]|nr:2-C-methyl-D-erythritol 4-phosphate cytidylyltransferase [Lentimicrobiaceae bacterium]
MKRYVIIVAAGLSKRMGEGTPKQFRVIAGKPMLMHTIAAFDAVETSLNIIVVIPPASIPTWQELCKAHNFNIPHQLVEGGPTRGYSVKNGLAAIEDDEGLVAIHDGARPLVDKRIILEGFELAARTGTAIPCVQLTDSLRLVDTYGSRALPRTKVKAIQTPQCFLLPMIKQAYDAQDFMNFTDDAQLIERSGLPLSLYDGNLGNIKVTTPNQLIYAEIMLQLQNKKSS